MFLASPATCGCKRRAVISDILMTMSASTGRAIRVFGSVTFALLAGACAPVATETVHGPDGTPWVSMNCAGGMQACWTEAATECPQGYVVADSAVVTSVGVPYDTPTGQMLFKCADRAGSPVATSGGEPTAAAPADAAPAADPSTCLHALEHFDEIAATWVATHRDRSAAPRPSGVEFVSACRELPAEAQTCLVAPFRKTHEDRCELTLAGLDRATRRRLDALFLTPADERASP